MVEPIKRKRGRPPKIKTVQESMSIVPVFEKLEAQTTKVEAPPTKLQVVVPINPAQQKIIDKSNADRKKKLDKAAENATADNIVERLFEALGGADVAW
jgi:hypothetical protein